MTIAIDSCLLQLNIESEAIVFFYCHEHIVATDHHDSLQHGIVLQHFVSVNLLGVQGPGK
jgi:hypothetical protein